ncbi:T9SS type A sorting domain-containing protein, partial [Candidatus Aerophobetes bacterium]
DDQYATGGESVVNWGTDGVDNDGDGHIDNPAEQGIYVITYLISTANGQADASYSVSVMATDGAGNSASSSISLTLDNTTPSGSISINNDATYTNSRTVTLTLSATNATQMQFSNDASSWSDWEDYSTTKSWTLSSGDGTKTVYVKFKDTAGNISEAFSDDIILDSTPPTASITSPSADTSVRGQVVIRGTASGYYFKEYKVEYGQGTEPSSWTEITSSASEVTDDTLATWDTTVLSDGSYTLRLTAQDLAGNSAQTKVSLRVNKHPPKATLIDYPSETVSGNIPKVPVTFTWRGSDPDGITPVEKLVYQYKLEGHLDCQDWSDWSSETTKTYMLPSGSYTFKVRAKDEAGSYPEEDDPATAKSSFTVSLPIIIYPNPCYPNQGQIVTIANLPLASEVKIYIYDVGGNLVRTLGENETNIEGESKTATWDCRNENGQAVARGIYIYFIPGATEKKTGKIAIIK